MPKSAKIMAKNPSLSVNQLIMAELLKKMKVKAKPMKGGACCVDYIAKEKKKKLDPAQRKELIKMLNGFMRESKKNQVGGGILQDWFTGKKAKHFWKSFGDGFVRGFTGTAKIAAPILDIASVAFPALAPVAGGVHVFNKLVN
jgi:hypothetical protein